MHCGFPDVLDRNLAFAPHDHDDEDARCLCECHRSIMWAATGVGSYPAGCLPEHPNVHAVTVWEDVASYGSHLKRPLTESEFRSIIDAKVWGPSGDPNGRPFTMQELVDTWGDESMIDVIYDFCAEAVRRIGVIFVRVFTHDRHHNIHTLSRVIPGSTIGLGWYPGSTCSEEVELHIDSGYTAGFPGQVGLKLHEFGHTLQLPHQFTNQGVHQEPMSYSYTKHLFSGFSTGERVFGLPRAPSMDLLENLYGGEPVGVPWQGKFENVDPPQPPKPPPEIPTDVTERLVAVEKRLQILSDETENSFLSLALKLDDQPTLPAIVSEVLASIQSDERFRGKDGVGYDETSLKLELALHQAAAESGNYRLWSGTRDARNARHGHIYQLLKRSIGETKAREFAKSIGMDV